MSIYLLANRILMVLTLLILFCATAFATPTGLNNIPTADIAPENVLVLQAFAEFGQSRTPTWFTGAKYGLTDQLEIGLDDQIAGLGSSNGPVFQAKFRHPLGSNIAGSLGAATLSTDTDRNGETFPYLVVSGRLGDLNGHLGHSWQQDNHAWFLGIDHSLSDTLTLRADWIEVLDGEEYLASFGFIKQISSQWLIEAWATLPTESGVKDSYSIKLDYAIPQ